jgi:hypothetical protein
MEALRLSCARILVPEMPFHILFVTFLAGLVLAPAAEAAVCLMMYQMADTNLEDFIRADNAELSNSAIVNSDNLRTWVYYDALTSTAPLAKTYDSDGNRVTEPFAGSRYLVWDKSVGNGGGFVIDQELSGEQDSDTLSTVQNFLERALLDCLGNGFSDLMGVFASHGIGVGGFGGDYNVPDRQTVQLLPNAGLATAISSALANTEGAPAKLSVLAFDACSMNALGAADDFLAVADHLVASEALVPGAGRYPLFSFSAKIFLFL